MNSMMTSILACKKSFAIGQDMHRLQEMLLTYPPSQG